MEQEIWKDILGFEGLYQASSLGKIRSLDRIITAPSRWKKLTSRKLKGKLMKSNYLTRGYHRIQIGGGVYRSIHILVALAFLGPKPSPKHQVNHKNGIKTDNRVVNLEWVTAAENIQHSVKTGLHSENAKKASLRWRGVNHFCAKLTESDIREIRASKEDSRVLAKKYGISRNYIYGIKRKDTWKHIE